LTHGDGVPLDIVPIADVCEPPRLAVRDEGATSEPRAASKSAPYWAYVSSVNLKEKLRPQVLGPGCEGRGSLLLLKIRVGYTMEDLETIDGTEYNVEELKSADLELIRRTLDATSTVFPVATYPGIKRLTFDTAKEAVNGRVRDITYGVSFGRST